MTTGLPQTVMFSARRALVRRFVKLSRRPVRLSGLGRELTLVFVSSAVAGETKFAATPFFS